ncbi:MAG: glycoside hydrolase family 32 protein [Fimbriimonadaceae bacterium]|nr:glycoside hydrolase family 32 protein [Fimbriimonadaceae bacterium]
MPIRDPVLELEARARFLHLPIKNGAPKRDVTLEIGDSPPQNLTIELSDSEPDWWTSVDISSQVGKTIRLTTSRLPAGSTAFSQVFQSNDVPGVVEAYGEAKRGLFHFSPRRGWLNDPNGLVYFQEEYHLFFQHNPYGWGWGNMHWGHAVSRDLVRWTELPPALLPDLQGTMYSGSAVVDVRNDSGLGVAGKPPLLLFYTAAGNPFTQGMASSMDGRIFTKWPGNPVVPHIAGENRDPKVFYHAQSHRWVMVLYVEEGGEHTLQFFNSQDLRSWTLTSKISGFYECPDLVALPLDGESDQMKWVLSAANSDYMVGSFEGERFTPDTPIIKGQSGRGFYAAQTFNGIPESDNRVIQIGWFQTETRGEPFNQAMSFPMELGLITTPSGPRLTWTPVRELGQLEDVAHDVRATTLRPGSVEPWAGFSAEAGRLTLEFLDTDSILSLNLRGLAIIYDGANREIRIGNLNVAVPPSNGRQRLDILVDRIGVEVFAGGGQVFIPYPQVFDHSRKDWKIGVEKGEFQFTSVRLARIKSAWTP